MNVIDEWQVEMERMLGIFEHESELSLRKINHRFEALDRPFNDEFRQYFLDISTRRLDLSFAKIKMERWNNTQVKSGEGILNSGRESQSIKISSSCSTCTSSIDTAMDVQLSKVDRICSTLVKSENVIEIIDSDDDIRTEGPTRAQNTVSGSNDRKNDSKTTAVIGHNVQSGRGSVEASTPIIRCSSERNDDKNSMNSDNSLNGVVEVNNQSEIIVSDIDKTNTSTKDEIEAVKMIETLDEQEQIPMTTFDPIQEINRSIAENDSFSSKRQANTSSNVFSGHQSSCRVTNRFKCEHCDYSSNWNGSLIKHQRIHANGKLIGIAADSKGLYHCTHCVRQFTDVGNLSQHLKSHKDNRYLYECSRCMRKRFVRMADKDSHENQCACRHYQCHLCKVFVTSRSTNLQIHMRKHSGEKPFRCMVCDKAFTQKFHLIRHLNSVHNRNHS